MSVDGEPIVHGTLRVSIDGEIVLCDDCLADRRLGGAARHLLMYRLLDSVADCADCGRPVASEGA